MIERLLAAEAALGRDELDAAEALFATVTAADPRNAIAVVGLARIALRRGDDVAARSLAMRALEIDPDEAAARRLLVEVDRAASMPPAPEPPEEALAPSAQARPRGFMAWLRRLLGRG